MTIGLDASVKRADATLLCFQCNQPNHLARAMPMAGKDEGLDEAVH